MTLILSAAELATLWSPAPESLGNRVKRVGAKWLPASSNTFIDPADVRQIALGMGLRSDGTWSPVGVPYDKFRFIEWVTAPMGRGKSEWLRNLLAGLFRADAGFMALDCKAKDLVNTTLPLVPLSREKDVILVDLEGTKVTGEDLRVSMNLLSPSLMRSLGTEPTMMASTILGIFATLDSRFNEAVGIKQFAQMGMLALLGGEQMPTMMHLIRFFGDEDYRGEICGKLPGSLVTVSDFWLRRFAEMPEGQKSSLASFERRLDQMLAFPELQAMLVAPGCSIDLRQLMDNKGILLMGISASQGQVASLAITLLLTQLLLAALSRTNVPEAQRPDWPVIIDEVQIVANANSDLFKVMLSQFRSMRIGQVLVHQGLSQIGPDVQGPLSDNAAFRTILGCEANDAGTYAGIYSSQGLNRDDFTSMDVHPKYGYALHQYMKFQGTGLFSSRPLPMAQTFVEDPPEPVYVDWHTVRAEAKSAQDKEIDGHIARFSELARVKWDEAVQRLGMAAKGRPDVYDLYCARTRAHRAAQRAFILDNPGCVPQDTDMADPQARALDQKLRRIRTLSALKTGIPRMETEALGWALLMSSADASTARRAREAAEKEAKKGGGKGKANTGAGPGPNAAAVPRTDAQQAAQPGTPAADTSASAPASLPTYEDLTTKRGWKRDIGDSVEGADGW